MSRADKRRASDPNTPPEELVRLSVEYPAEVLANASLPLISLASPDAYSLIVMGTSGKAARDAIDWALVPDLRHGDDLMRAAFPKIVADAERRGWKNTASRARFFASEIGRGVTAKGLTLNTLAAASFDMHKSLRLPEASWAAKLAGEVAAVWIAQFIIREEKAEHHWPELMGFTPNRRRGRR
jgi:hypothetical protein